MQEILSRNSPDQIHFQNKKISRILEIWRVCRGSEDQSADLLHVTDQAGERDLGST